MSYKQTPYSKGGCDETKVAHVSKEEVDLRKALAYGDIDLAEFDKQMTLLKV